MNLLVCLIFIVTNFSFLDAALSNRWEVPEGRIVGGHEAVPHSHPYLVSLQLRFLWVRMHICGGTLLSENWILTAGHCIKESFLIRWLPLDAIAGTHDVDNFGPKAQVASIDQRIAHPLYKGGIGPNDIAMLKTKTPFTFTREIQPAHLPLNYKISPQSLTLAGWGVIKSTFFIPDLPSKLQEVSVTYIPYEECYKAVEEIKDEGEGNPLDKDSNICSGPTSGGIAACNGDSGGPLVCNAVADNSNDTVEELTQENEDSLNEVDVNLENFNSTRQNEEHIGEDRVAVLLGVVSWGASPCGGEGAPTVYTKVSRYIDFINQYMNS